MAASAQATDFYAGKPLTILVGLEAGGTVDTLARAFAVHLRKHIPGNPTIVVQNMPGAGGIDRHQLSARARGADGLTILYGPWDPLAQALGDQALRARYENFEYLGGTGDIRVNYARTDTVPGGIKAPRDIMKAENVILGALNKTDISGLLPQARPAGARREAPDDRRLSRRQRRVPGDAARRGAVPLDQHLDLPRPQRRPSSSPATGSASPIWCRSIATAPTRRAATSPKCRRSPISTRRFTASCPSGPDWDALNWLTNQTGEMTFVGFAPRGTPAAALAALRTGFEGASNDRRFRQRRDQAQRRAVHVRQRARAGRRSSARSPT